MSSSSSRAFRRARAGALAAGLVASAAGALIFGHAQDAQADYATDCASPTQTYTTANPAPLNLTVNPGDVFLFASGTYTGNVDANGGAICVVAGVTFSPGSVNGSPRVFNRGTALFPGLAAGNNSLFDNEGTATFAPVPNTNGPATVFNRAGATLTVNSGFSLGPGAVTTNDGTIVIHGGLNLNGATTVNNGSSTIEGPLNVSGSYTNNAQATITGTVTVNGDGELSNNCSLTANRMINNKTVSNSGIIHLLPGGRDPTPSLLNNGGATFTQTNTALTLGGDFTNTGLVNGAGQYRFTGASTNIGSGTFAGASAADPIVFFDVSLAGGPIFDTETGTHTNTVRQEVEVPPVGACNVEPPTPPTTTTTASTTTAPTTTAPTTTAPTTTTTPETTTTDGATTTTGVSTTTTAGATTTTMDPTTSTAGATTTTGDVEAVTVSSSDPAADDTLPHTGSSWPARGLPGALLFIAVGAASVMATRRRSVR